jgi:DNA repair exonuclease SbcCD ATPase subunit
MNYREQQLRDILKKQYVPKDFHQQTVQRLEKLQEQNLIATLQKDLGIDFTSNYPDLIKQLKGRTIRQVLEEDELKEETIEQAKLVPKLTREKEQLIQEKQEAHQQAEQEKQALQSQINQLEREQDFQDQVVKKQLDQIQQAQQTQFQTEQTNTQLFKDQARLTEELKKERRVSQFSLVDKTKKDQAIKELETQIQKIKENEEGLKQKGIARDAEGAKKVQQKIKTLEAEIKKAQTDKAKQEKKLQEQFRTLKTEKEQLAKEIADLKEQLAKEIADLKKQLANCAKEKAQLVADNEKLTKENNPIPILRGGIVMPLELNKSQ